MKVKVCGTRDPENILELLQLPIDFIGFIFYRKSPRFLKEDGFPEWLEQNATAFGNVRRVGVFVNAEIDEILNKVHDFQLDYVQLHGSERPEYCRELLSFWEISSLRKASLIKAFSVGEDFDFNQTNPYSGLCSFFLFDTKTPEHGGSGRQFDWSILSRYQGTTPFLLAGGIGPESAGQLRQVDHPQLAGVDINSRFETKPGRKDIGKVRQFLQELGKEQLS